MDDFYCVVLLGIPLIILSIFCFSLWEKNQKLTIEIETLKKSDKTKELEKKIEDNLKNLENMTKVQIGDKGIYTTGLHWKDNNEHFSVTFDVEIIEISTDKFKIKAFNFTSSNKKMIEWKKKNISDLSGTLQHATDIWVNKKEVDLVVRADIRRQINLSKLLDDKN